MTHHNIVEESQEEPDTDHRKPETPGNGGHPPEYLDGAHAGVLAKSDLQTLMTRGDKGRTDDRLPLGETQADQQGTTSGSKGTGTNHLHVCNRDRGIAKCFLV